MSLERFTQIDEEGYFLSNGLRVTDEDYGRTLLAQIVREERGRCFLTIEGHQVWVEAFDEPLVAKQVEKRDGDEWELLFPYGYRAQFKLSTLSLDEWDRFHGSILSGVPFVMSRPAQSEFFRILDDYDDESITANGVVYQIPPWLLTEPEVNRAEFWSHRYQEKDTPWDLAEPTPVLVETLAKIKLPKSRILVPGCGAGNDAAYLARQGHVVTGFDFSPEAIRVAQERYGQIPHLEFQVADVFKLPDTFTNSFDVIFEHTCYCAVNPVRRNELIRVWKRVLVDGGHLLGVFFATDKRLGPPFGGSEWEVRERLKAHFEFLYWTRWRKSVPNRQGAELLVYARKRS
ncbi:MAG: methyltransferase domain-containing protein [Bdellovibrionales bacterium]|nr:methyltransferase domain-containing protein [Bdellovibrionales bacterium]